MSVVVSIEIARRIHIRDTIHKIYLIRVVN